MVYIPGVQTGSKKYFRAQVYGSTWSHRERFLNIRWYVGASTVPNITVHALPTAMLVVILALQYVVLWTKSWTVRHCGQPQTV